MEKSTPAGDGADTFNASVSWIAIQPPQKPDRGATSAHTVAPPSFVDAQYDVILRRQRMRPKEGGLKLSGQITSRFLNLSNHFEFAGWGSIENLKLPLQGPTESVGDAAPRDTRNMGQFMASALAGSDILGGVFYALPALFSIAGVYSPISMFASTMTLFLWRPVMEELASAFPMSGAPYIYLLNVSNKAFSLVGAVLLLLDFAATAAVSAATAATYLAGEVTLPFPTFVGTILVLVIFAGISLGGARESARISLIVLAFHLLTMALLVVFSAIKWGRMGNSQLRDNWAYGQESSPGGIARQIFNGFCVGMLGLTGYECSPAHAAHVKPGTFPRVLRNLHLSAIILDTSLVTIALALLPFERITSGANVLSNLAEEVAGKWLRIWIVFDAVIVLCGGVLTGIVSATELITQLAQDGILPQAFLRKTPVTGSPWLAILVFVIFSGALYASASTSLNIVSEMFSLVWLTVMALFPLSLLLLKYSRPRLPREKQTSLAVILGALATSAVVFAGNVVIHPSTVGYFSAYFLGVLILSSITQYKIHFLRCVYWVYDQHPALHRWRWTKSWGERLIKQMVRLRRQPVSVFAKSDEINHLAQMVAYVRQNEETSSMKIIHFHDGEAGIPSELEANTKILDEAFPELTIDLVLVHGEFSPDNIVALSHHLQIPRSLMFMSCPGQGFRYTVADMGMRIISL